MKTINSRSGILPGAIIMVALFFIFDKLNANRDYYIITLGLVTVIVEFFTSLICDYNRKINKFKRRAITTIIFLVAVIIISIIKVKNNIDDMAYFIIVGILNIIVAICS